ncbi:hypothetical protein EJB05_28470, partial [Eragrostis curvula]
MKCDNKEDFRNKRSELFLVPSCKRNEGCPGIVATLRRTNPLQMISDLRKTHQRVTYAGKAGDARYLLGKLCFMSTPDGENCGLVKNLAVTAIVSSKFRSLWMSKLYENPTKEVTKMDKSFLDGTWVGSCNDPASFVLQLSLIDPQRHMVKAIQRDLNSDHDLKELERYLDVSIIITNGLNPAFSTGIVATLRRTNPLQMISDLRKTCQRVAYSGIHPTGRKVCFMFTPDGKNCGLVKKSSCH